VGDCFAIAVLLPSFFSAAQLLAQEKRICENILKIEDSKISGLETLLEAGISGSFSDIDTERKLSLRPQKLSKL
jgi:hypothetical protein